MAADQEKRYRYSFDEHIRLLRLSRETEDLVHCEVQTFTLRKAPKYLALSYEWGSRFPVRQLFVNGKPLNVRANLYSCLLELRMEVEDYLWIDQICIDQENTTERNRQVALMPQIYTSSASVIVWIGNIPLTLAGDTESFSDLNLDRSSLAVLLQHSYFTRLWIVQELLLAREIRVFINGRRWISWRRMQEVLDEWRETPGLWDPGRIAAATAIWLVQLHHPEGGTWLTLLRCLETFSGNACEEPKDKVYGLLGIVRYGGHGIIVDYTKSVYEVYLDVVLTVFASNIESTSEDDILILLALGRNMGFARHEMLGLQPFLEDDVLRKQAPALFPARGRLGYRPRADLSGLGFEGANSSREQDCWWYVFRGKTYKHYCPTATPSSLLSTPPNHLLPLS